MESKLSECAAQIASDRRLLEVARKAIEDVLVDFRDSRISLIRGNGLVVRESDGTESHIIRLGPEDAMRIGLKAITSHLEALKENPPK